MTHISNDNRPVQRPARAMPHWLVFAITLLALSAPIGALLFTAWLAVVRPVDLVVSTIELAYIGVATVLIGTAMASYVHRGRSLPRRVRQ